MHLLLILLAQSVTAAGTGEVRLAPDWAVVTIGIDTRDATAAAAQRRHAVIVERVWDAIARAGVPRDSVKAAWTRVAPIVDYEAGREIRGYEATTGLRFSLRALEQLSAVLDGALGAGATAVRGIEQRSTAEDAARVDALRRAVLAARADATAMAEALGGRLGPLEALTSAPTAQPVARMEVAYLRAAPERPDLPEIIVRATVRGTWGFLPQPSR